MNRESTARPCKGRRRGLRSGMRAAVSATVVIIEAGNTVARTRVARRAVAASPRRAIVPSRRRCADSVGLAA